MKVVSNTSPLIFLGKLDAWDTLEACFQHISIPYAVQAEAGSLSLPEFIQVRSISEWGQHYVAGAMGALHAGELEAIQLAQESKTDWVLLDDLKARRAAKRKGLNVIGTLGVLQLAYHKKHLNRETLLAYYDALEHQHGLWLSAAMWQRLRAIE